MFKTSNKDSTWKNYCNKINALIEQDNDEFPTEDDINKLVKYTERAFRNSPFMQHAMEKVFEIRRRWVTQDSRRKRREKERQLQMEEPVVLSEEITAYLKNVINKIAVDYKIAAADSVKIKISPEEGIITFNGVEEQGDINANK